MMEAPEPRPGASSPLFGRAEILEEVDRLLARSRDGHGSGILLIGANGSGKSTALQAVIELGRTRGFRVLTGHSVPEELAPPFALVRDLLGTVDPAGESRKSGPGDGVSVPLYMAPFAGVMPTGLSEAVSAKEPVNPPSEFGHELGPLGILSGIEGHGAAREELLGHLEEFFRSRAQDQPLLIAIDDLHLADLSSLDFLRRFALGLPETRATIVATSSVSSEVPERNRLLLGELERLPSFRRAPLRVLTVPEATEFIQWICGGRVPDPRDVLKWHAETEGNPLFLEQLVRQSTGYGVGGGPHVPESGQDVTALLLTRVRGLAEAEQRVLAYAAVLGKQFQFADLATVVGAGEEPVTESLDRLVESGLLREKGKEVYEFVTEAVRTSVYSDLTETRRRIMHRKAGLALEVRGGANDSELARQFYLGRDDERAVRYNVTAAQIATHAFAFETAYTHLSRALEAQRRLPEKSPRTEIRFLTEEGMMLIEMDDIRRAEMVLTEAVTVARASPGHELELGRALLGLAQARYRRGEYPAAVELATESWTFLVSGGTLRDRMDAHRVLGTCFQRQGDLRQAEAHQREALDIAERVGTPIEQGRALTEVANTMVMVGPVRHEAALEFYSRASKRFANGQDHADQARVMMDRSVLEWMAGRIEESLRDLSLAIDAAELSRSRTWIGYCHINLAELQAERNRPDLARPALERAVQCLAPIGDGYAEQQIAMARGMIAHAERDFGRAEVSYQEALAQARTLHQPSEIAEMLLRLAELAHDRGDDLAAQERLFQARDAGVLERRPDFTSRVRTLELACADATHAKAEAGAEGHPSEPRSTA